MPSHYDQTTTTSAQRVDKAFEEADARRRAAKPTSLLERIDAMESSYLKALEVADTHGPKSQAQRSVGKRNVLQQGYPTSASTVRPAPATPPPTSSGAFPVGVIESIARSLQLAREGRSPVGDVVPSPLMGAGGRRAYNQGPMIRTAWPPGAQAPTTVFGGPITPSQTGLMNLSLRQGGAMPGRSGKGGL